MTDRNNCFGPVLREIRSHKGARVRGLGNSAHNGRRGEAMVDHEIERRGGAREKGPAQSARPLREPFRSSAICWPALSRFSTLTTTSSGGSPIHD